MRSICLLGVQVAVEGKGWMVLAIDWSDFGSAQGIMGKAKVSFRYHTSTLNVPMGHCVIPLDRSQTPNT